MEIILAAAADFEIKPSLHALRELGVVAQPCIIGVGALDSARRSKETANACAGAHVIFVGTCGIFDSFSKPQLVSTQTAVWLPTAVRTGDAYLIKGTEKDISFGKSTELSSNLERKDVICASAISTNPGLPQGFDPSTCVENLELYSCGQNLENSCSRLDILLCTTNQIGPDAHKEWKSNFRTASELAANQIVQYFSNRRPTQPKA